MPYILLYSYAATRLTYFAHIFKDRLEKCLRHDNMLPMQRCLQMFKYSMLIFYLCYSI